MKTLHITNNWHGESGGVSVFYRELMKAAERLGRRMVIVAPGARAGVEKVGRFCRIYRVPGRPSRISPGYWLLTPEKYLLPGSPLRAILDAERPDLIDFCDKYTLNYLAALLRRGWLTGRAYRPTLVGTSCERMDENMALYLSTSRAAERFCRAYMNWLYFPMFDHHIANSSHCAGELREAARGHHVRRGVWIRPMGASTSLFTPQRRNRNTRDWLLAQCGVSEDATLLLYAGRLVPEKNLQLLAATMEVLDSNWPDRFHLVVAGEGPVRSTFESSCHRKSPGAVTFLGHVAGRHTLADIVANCDIFLHPNPREPFGIAPLEAMASGLALVAPHSGGITTYANASNAWLVAPTAQNFACAVTEICSNTEASTQRRLEARATACRFDWEPVAESFFELYDDLHAFTQGRRGEPLLAPSFYSTPGDWLGIEVSQ